MLLTILIIAPIRNNGRRDNLNSNKIILFVYGTLQTGQRNHGLLAGSDLLGVFDLNGYALYELGSFPGIVRKPDGKVRGEAYLVSSETLSVVNEFEGEGYIYDLTDVCLSNDKGHQLSAKAYIFNRSVVGRKVIPYEQLPWDEKKVY